MASKAVVAACLGVGWIGVWVPDLVDSGRWRCRWNGCGCIVMLLLRSGVCAMLPISVGSFPKDAPQRQ